MYFYLNGMAALNGQFCNNFKSLDIVEEYGIGRSNKKPADATREDIVDVDIWNSNLLLGFVLQIFQPDLTTLVQNSESVSGNKDCTFAVSVQCGLAFITVACNQKFEKLERKHSEKIVKSCKYKAPKTRLRMVAHLWGRCTIHMRHRLLS